jgi:hypothetical protein
MQLNRIRPTIPKFHQMIDIRKENPVTLQEACALIPGRSKTGKVCYQTLANWTTNGCRGIVLETVCIGLARYTSAEALDRFFRTLTAVRNDSLNAAAIDSRRISRRRRNDEADRIRARLQKDHGI